MSNKIEITDIMNRLEDDIYRLSKQELRWQSRVILNNFRDKIKDLEIEYGLTNYIIFKELNGFLDAEEKSLEDTITQ